MKSSTALKTLLIILFIVIPFCNVNPKIETAQNFPVYNIKGERQILYKIIETLPDKGFLIVNFTSVNCLPCKKELPELKNITTVSNGRLKLMCIYAESADITRESAEPLGVAEIAYVDPFGNIQKLYKVTKYPITFIIDKNYKILGRFEGYTPASIQKIKKLCGF